MKQIIIFECPDQHGNSYLYMVHQLLLLNPVSRNFGTLEGPRLCMNSLFAVPPAAPGMQKVVRPPASKAEHGCIPKKGALREWTCWQKSYTSFTEVLGALSLGNQWLSTSAKDRWGFLEKKWAVFLQALSVDSVYYNFFGVCLMPRPITCLQALLCLQPDALW